ncbi:MAG: hypothetical protein KKC53_03520 [Actinobacteria bacterium]|nr:hypothetical protein [Actinomycetota bacterium]
MFGINIIKLIFDHENGCGTWAMLYIDSGDYKISFGGSCDQQFMVILTGESTKN